MKKQSVLKAIYLLLLILYCTHKTAIAQLLDESWQVFSPVKDSVTDINDGLFIAAAYNGNMPDKMVLKVDGQLLVAEGLRIQQSRITYLTNMPLGNGRHEVQIAAFNNTSGKWMVHKWNFWVTNSRFANKERTSSNEQSFITGTITADNRSTFLSGNGSALRQEPLFTRTINADMQINLSKSVHIPIRFFNTSDNLQGYIPRNFFQIGFRSKLLDIDYGDLNPCLDQLAVTGIRVRGSFVKLKIGKSSLQYIAGNLVNEGINGLLTTYVPGSGMKPTTFVNDTQFIQPGVYRRWIMAGKLQLSGKKERVKWSMYFSKVKDDTASAKFGLAPKDNIVAGTDMQLNLFRKSLQINAGIALSVLTNDISGGYLTAAKVDSLFKIKFDYDLGRFEKIIILNTTTVPGFINKVADFTAWYAQLQHHKGSHTFSVDIKNNGASYFSLANPFLRNNYGSLNITERFSVWKRKIGFIVGYQSANNNLNGSLPTTILSTGFNGTVQFNGGSQLPFVAISYLQQQRTGNSKVMNVQAVNDRLQFYMANMSWQKKIGGILHQFRCMISYNTRTDEVRKVSGSDMWMYNVGMSTQLLKNVQLSADGGKTTLVNELGGKILDLFNYTVGLQWQPIPQKIAIAAGISENTMLATLYSNASNRKNIYLKAGFKIFKKMGIDLEGGIMPYTERMNANNNYQEKYVYAKWYYNF